MATNRGGTILMDTVGFIIQYEESAYFVGGGLANI
jgi:hypothetical protein